MEIFNVFQSSFFIFVSVMKSYEIHYPHLCKAVWHAKGNFLFFVLFIHISHGTFQYYLFAIYGTCNKRVIVFFVNLKAISIFLMCLLQRLLISPNISKSFNIVSFTVIKISFLLPFVFCFFFLSLSFFIFLTRLFTLDYILGDHLLKGASEKVNNE